MLTRFALLPALLLTLGLTAPAAGQSKTVWTDPDDPSLPADFQVQGEYAGKEIGAQVIALDNGKFQAVIYPGGLPGAGWDGEHKALFDGAFQGDDLKFRAASGPKQYIAQDPEKFSATDKFPPAGQDQFDALSIEDGEMKIVGSDGRVYELQKTTRQSKTMGAKPPEGAVVLFGGKAADMKHWKGGRFDEETKLLNTDGQDILTADKYDDYTMHLEFLLPYKPSGRGQGRGNSGFYQVDHYEVQILDSFGLEGKNNECGGVYTIKAPDVNMCLPPLVWQTYDVEFTNAQTDESGKVTEPAHLTVKHNGVVIHDDIELKSKTGGSRGEPIGTPGPIKLQGHGNPLQFRNVWIKPTK